MERSGSNPKFLHGDLELKIIEAKDLPNIGRMTQLPRFFVTCDTINPCPAVTVACTRIMNSLNPQWNEQFHIPLAHPGNTLKFQVMYGSNVIGTVEILAQDIVSGDLISGWFDLIGSFKGQNKPKIRIEMKFTPFEDNPAYKHGIASDPEYRGVRHTYFPLRKGGSMRLYQDAHVPDGLLTKIELDRGKVYELEKCWEDICYGISEAHHLIYIVGWSVFHKVNLVREQTRSLPRGRDMTLGELLKYKSEEGVRVLLLVWDDKTSHDKFINTTHSKETKNFFKSSSVTCVLAPGYSASSKMDYFKKKGSGTPFTHNQKCVLVDTQASGNYRKIIAFLGGIDLCVGRYDTPQHRLFRDMSTVFKDDYHNPTFPAGTKPPRQPWHDLHCRVEGPAAYDVLMTFEQCWRKATKLKESGISFKMNSHSHDDDLVKINHISWIKCPAPFVLKDGVPKDDPELWVSSEDDPESWHIQILRSIDSGSLEGFPTSADLTEKQNLIWVNNLVIDKSIQAGYIQAIRSAQHFIYIENQYFHGSSYAWPSYENAGADNLIPMELALKIASKIRAKERFAVYIVLPMWPKGDPTTEAMQEILFWQSQTMQMMYTIVARELDTMPLVDSHPQHYLNFYCLGNREDTEERLRDNADKVADAQKFKRFMIYVHAKGMIVDDEYVIVGSANINQRSMAGTKVTEIAMGAYQPHHTWGSRKGHPHGQVYGYRMSLWAEHLGMLNTRLEGVESWDSCFKEPESLDCVMRVNDIAEGNWERYTDETFTLLQGHLLKYPVQVERNGKINPLPGHENFPGVGGKVLGAHSTTLPDILTT